LALILALLSAAVYGTADFLGGVAARRSAALAATVVAQGCGLVLVALALPLFPAEPPSTVGALWGAGAGVTGGAGVAAPRAARARRAAAASAVAGARVRGRGDRADHGPLGMLLSPSAVWMCATR